MRRFVFWLTLLLLFSSVLSYGQHLWQQPKPLVKKEKLVNIIGPIFKDTLNKPLHMLWVYGYDEHHIAGAHDYEKVKDLMLGLLQKVPKVSVEEVFYFPSQAQFDQADLIVMYLHLPELKKKQFSSLQNFIQEGGGIVSLHETAIMRPASKGRQLSKSLGSAWKEGTSKWGAIFEDITVDTTHVVFSGFPRKLTINDEFYWDLYQEDSMKVLGTVRTGPDEESSGPVSEEELSATASPVFWTYALGEGKVFGTTTGHHTFTYYDPEFRIILFRAMAWAIDASPDPFMPLVFDGITNEEGMVGTTQDMRYWKGKKRP